MLPIDVNYSTITEIALIITVRCHIPTFYHDTTVMITNNGVHNDSFTNYTTKGAEIQLLCKNGTNQTDGSMTVFRAVCRENGMWLPDLSEHECTSDQSKQKSEFNIKINMKCMFINLTMSMT